jgi:AraC-like DNA-binding protein
VLSRYLRLVNASLITQVEDHGEVVLIREDLLADGGEPVRQSMELALGVMVRLLVELLGPGWRPRSVWLAHRAPSDRALHRAMFGPSVKFDAPFNGVVCAAADLAAPLPEGDSGMAAFARSYLDQALSRHGSRAIDRTRELVTALLPGGRCTAEQVALHLSIDRRTLHRHLAADGTSFTALLAEVRRELAERQLSQSDRPLAELADLLGFSSASAFAFWFRRHYGCTAGEWRLRMAADRPRPTPG